MILVAYINSYTYIAERRIQHSMIRYITVYKVVEFLGLQVALHVRMYVVGINQCVCKQRATRKP